MVNNKMTIGVLMALPFVAQLMLLPVVNRINPIVFGLPFLQFWLFLWVFLTPLCTFGIYRIQKTQGRLD